MYTIKATVKDGLIHPLESINLPDGTAIEIIIIEEDKKDKPSEKTQKLSELLLCPELEENDSLFERDKDTGREIVL